MATLPIVQTLGGTQLIGPISDAVDMARRVRSGLPWACLEFVSSTLHLKQVDFANLLHITPRTLSRRKVEGKLEATESDRLFRVARVLAHAEDVFNSPDKARDWLASENRALAGQRPLQLLDTDAGTQEVENVLGRIEHGIFG